MSSSFYIDSLRFGDKHRVLQVRQYLPMAKKVTSSKVASQASQALRDGRSSSRTKSIAGSALSQREKKTK